MPLRAFLVALGLLLAMPLTAVAQTPGLPGQAGPPAAAPADVQRLISTLEDPAARERLVADLKTLLAAEQKQQQAVSPVDAVGAQLLQVLSEGLGTFSEFLLAVGRGIGDPRRLLNWTRQQFEDPLHRAVWADVLLKLALVLGAGGLAGWLIGRGIQPIARRTEQRNAPTIWHKIPLALARLILDLVPIGAFAIATYVVLLFAAPSLLERLVLLAAINAGVIAGVGTALARTVFCPFAPNLRLFHMDDESAAYAYVWTRRLIQLVLYGYFILQAAVLLGLPRSGYHVAFKLFGLLIALLLIVLVLQNRDAVAQLVRGGRPDGGEGLAAVGAGGVRSLRRRLAEVWHILALFYVAAVYLVWALGVRGGFDYIVRSTAITLAVLIAARVVLGLTRRAGGRLLAINQDLLRRYPLIEERANRYLPHLRRALLALLQVITLFLILAAWQIDVGAVLRSDTGRQLLGRLASIGLVLGLSLLIWELTSGMITVYLQRRDQDGRVLLRSARARTLLPLVRNALLVLISVMAGLTALSQLSIDIAPLLAGAGVVGLAVGFGAQTLVKDVITGAFILFEDTVNVGDVANINGTSGQVEGMTIRTIRLRDGSGTVHTIPFGSINSISNLTKDFSYYLLDIGVGYRENTDAVQAAMQQVFDGLRKDPAFGPDMIDDFEILGVDRFGESAVHIQARIKTLPVKQWGVGREYNRRLKMKFDELGIEMPFPHRTIYLGVDKQGNAPPLRIQPLAGGTEQPPPPAPAKT